MDFDFSKDQEMIRKSAREFLEKECPKDRVRELKTDDKGYDPKVWDKMVELGFLGLILPEQYEGMGGEYLEGVIFMEEIGRNLLPSPYFTTVGLCAQPICQFGTDAQKGRFLPKIADGQIWSLAMMEANAGYEASDIELSAVQNDGQYALTGTKIFVPYANSAENLLVVARTGTSGHPEDGITVFVVDAESPGISIEVIPTTARDMRCEVNFDNVIVSGDDILGAPDKGWMVVEHILQYATVLKCAEMSGGAQTVLDIANKYAKERIQFDKPIGSFQAIQHKLANMLIWVEGLKYLVYEAAWQINIGKPSKEIISMAKVKANEVYQRVCIDGIYIHGAIGTTEEMDIGLYHLKTKAMEFDLGGSEFHRERIVQQLEARKPLFLSV
jgi:alkylation response protein AidB-like acyl-CoA dehydrogenase